MAPSAAGPRRRRRGERRWFPALTVLILVAMPFLTPLPRTTGLVWVLPIVCVPLLIAIVAVDPGRIDRRSSLLRFLGVLLTSFLALTALVATIRLVVELVRGAPNLDTAGELLLSGGFVWVGTILAFALLYWELDGGGSAERLVAPRDHPDIAFPQHMNPELAEDDWMPIFPDYLYLAFTNALAFSPTDAMPLAHWVKALMALQAVISVVILSLVIANAVNILN